MKLLVKLILPMLILVVTAVIVYLVLDNPPEAKRQRPSAVSALTVEVDVLERQAFQMKLDSFGVVRPRTQGYLMSQVSGQIVYVNDAFRSGGFFEKGEVLVAIEDTDFKAELNIANANIISAKQSLDEEMARSKQALIDWERLGDQSQPNDLVLRLPQQESAKAVLASAEAQYTKAKLAYERTKIKAPYNGRIVTQNVDIGSVISANTVLADIYATDALEVRLAINNSDLAFVKLPESKTDNSLSSKPLTVEFTSDLIGKQSWTGNVVRTESEIDSSSRQLYVVAQINNPFEQETERGVSIKIGEYVRARIQGKLVEDALIIPVTAIYQASFVYVVENGILLRKNIETSWQNDDIAIVISGLEAGQRLVTTPLGQISSGKPVTVVGEAPKKKRGPDHGEKRTGARL